MNTTKIVCLSAALALAGCTADPLVEQEATTPVNKVVFVHSCKDKKSTSVAVKFQSQVIDRVEENFSASRSAGILSRSGLTPLDQFMNDYKAVSFKRVFPEGKYEERTRKSGLHLWYQINFDESVDNLSIENALKNIDGLQIVEFPYEVISMDPEPREPLLPRERRPRLLSETVQYPVNDPYLSDQWNYFNDGSITPNSVARCDINLFKAWEKCMGNPDVIVAVIDQAVDYEHPDLKENMWVNEAEKNGQPGVDDDQNGYVDDIYGYDFGYNTTLDECNEHGTHVAGTIAAVNNNGIGVCGIAGGSGKKDGVKIMSCQIISNLASATHVKDAYSHAKAVKYATDNGAVILQNSWGISSAYFDYWGSSDDKSMSREAFQYFIDFAGIDENGKTVGPVRGGVVCFCSGNDGLVNQGAKVWPSAYSPFVAVSAVGCDFRPAYYTDYGNWVDVAAPGGDIDFDGLGIYSTSTRQGSPCYMDKQGTSMSCPHASGVAALIISYAHQNHFELTGSQVSEILVSSTYNIDSYFKGHKQMPAMGLLDGFDVNLEDYKGLMGGMLDASRALDMVDEIMGKPVTHVAPKAIDTPKLNISGPDFLSLQWKVSADFQGDPLQSYLVYFSQSPISIQNGKVQVDRQLEGPLHVSTQGLKVGDKVSAQIPCLETETTYNVALVGLDQWRMESEPVIASFETSFDHCGSAVADLGVSTLGDHFLTIQWKETEDFNHHVYDHYEVEYRDYRGNFNLTVASTGEIGGLCQCPIDGLLAATSYTFTVTGYDKEGMMGKPETLSVITKREFSIKPMFKKDVVLQYWEHSTLYYEVNKGEAQSWTARLVDAGDMWSITTDKYHVMLHFNGPVMEAGEGDLRIEIKDELDNTAFTDLHYQIVSNVAPGLKKSFSDYSFTKFYEDLVIDLDEYFADGNQEPLTFEVTQHGDAVEMYEEKGKLYCKTRKNGTSEINIRAVDAGGESIEGNFSIDVFEMPAGKELLLYPNPVKDVVNIRLADGLQGEVKILIRDASGRVLLETRHFAKVGKPMVIDASSLDAGFLFVEVRHQGKTYKENVIKL